MASIIMENDMEVEFVSAAEIVALVYPGDAVVYPEDDESAMILGYNVDSIRRRLEIEFDNEANPLYSPALVEEGEVYEESPPLDVIIVSHILSKNETGDFECPICYESILTAKRVTISCSHHFCMTCTVDLLKICQQEGRNVSCPMCRHPCFLLETPDEPQFQEIGNLLDEFEELRYIRERDYEAFRHYHYA